jgi:hypothetical protein
VSGLPLEDRDDLFELQTFGLRQVPGVNVIASTARQANPTITHASPHLWFKVGKASMITKLANQSTLAQIAAARPRTPAANTRHGSASP